MPVGVGGALTLADVVAVARGAAVEFPDDGPRARGGRPRASIERVVASGETVYGVTTGFGSLADVRIDPSQAAALQLGIVRSHATAVGRPLSRQEARAMLLLRAHVLALGHSGVRPLIVERMVEMLNRDLIPSVPEQGSLGASGDLAPLANLALPLIGQGELLTRRRDRARGGPALAVAGLAPIALEAKEGLALVNGTQGMLAVGILAAERVSDLARTADVAAAMSVEAALGTDAAFDERLQRLRPHPGQAASASNLRRLLAGSPILSSHRDSPHLVQDAYSLRCAPQVHGATRDVLTYVAQRPADREAIAVSDNPIVLAGRRRGPSRAATSTDSRSPSRSTRSRSRRSGSPSISERRLYRLLDPKQNNGLPAFLVEGSGAATRASCSCSTRRRRSSRSASRSRTRRRWTRSRPRRDRRTT